MSTDENAPTLWVGDEQLQGVTLSPLKEMAPPQEAGTVHGHSCEVPPKVDRWDGSCPGCPGRNSCPSMPTPYS